jgi:hypothetical protein
MWRVHSGGACRCDRAKMLAWCALYHNRSFGNKGVCLTWMGDATPQRGGRAKRMVRVTPKGVRAANDFHDTVTALAAARRGQ